MRRRLITLLAPAVLGILASAQPAQSQPQLRIAIPGDDGSLTPYTFESGYAFMSLVYDTLTWRDAGGVARPWLAHSIGRSVSGRAVDVRLRPRIRWHDGRPLTAADVAFTYRFMAARPHPRFTPQLRDILAVQATGELTLRFTLRSRSLGLEDLAFADVPILPRHLWAGLARGRRAPPGRAVGSGPYRLASYEPGGRYRFQANRDYFRGVPSVARIDVPMIRRQDRILEGLGRRRLDAVPVAIPPGTTPRRMPGVRFSDEVSFSGTMLLFNVQGRPFDRLSARRAVAQALNLDRIAGNAGRTAGGTVPADRGMLHPRSRWSQTGELHRFDVAAARLAFAEQGVGPFRVAAPRNDPVRLAVGERVVRALRAAGADARLVELSPRAMDSVLGRGDEPATFDAAVVGIPALASYDPSFLYAIFGDPHIASLNDGGYRSSTFEDLAERMASASNRAQRRRVVHEQLRFLARDLPAVPLVYGGGTWAYRPRAYDRWVSVRGSGILDKRSFLRGAVTEPAGATGGAALEDLTDASDDGGFSLVPIIVGFVALLLAGGAWHLRRARR